MSGWVPPEPSPKSAGDVAKDVVGGILAGAVAVLGLLLMLFVAFGVPVLVFLFFRDSLGWFWSLMVAIGAFGLITAVLGSVAG